MTGLLGIKSGLASQWFLASTLILPSIGHGTPPSHIDHHTLASWHRRAVAGTFICSAESSLDNRIFSQFMSIKVVPVEKPSICVWIAADTPLVHMMLLIVVMLGEIADGGGDLTVVSALLVDSVTIG
jgi:hypothetical protein